MGHFENNHVIHGRSFHPARNPRAACLFFATDTLVSSRREISWIPISLNSPSISRSRLSRQWWKAMYIKSILEIMHRRNTHWQRFVVTLNYSKFQSPMDEYCAVIRKRLTPLTMHYWLSNARIYSHYNASKKLVLRLRCWKQNFLFASAEKFFSSPFRMILFHQFAESEHISILFMVVVSSVNKMKNLNLHYGWKILHDNRFICT